MSGNLSPPFFEPPPLGGGVSPTTDIFLRDTSNWYIRELDGDGFTISSPGIANDDLIVYMVSLAITDPTAVNTGWTRVWNPRAGYEAFHRVADGSANDDFILPTPTGNHNNIAQMAAFGNTVIGSPPNNLQNTQGGTLTQLPTGTSWTYGGMAAAGLDKSIVIFFGARLRTFVGVATSQVLCTDIENEIGTVEYGQATSPASSIWMQWGWEYHEAPEAMSASGSPITYSPTFSAGIALTQYTRWRLIP
jgi:hypothetical protein